MNDKYKHFYDVQRLLNSRTFVIGDKYSVKFFRTIEAAIEQAYNEAEAQRKADQAALVAKMRAGEVA